MSKIAGHVFVILFYPLSQGRAADFNLNAVNRCDPIYCPQGATIQHISNVQRTLNIEPPSIEGQQAVTAEVIDTSITPPIPSVRPVREEVEIGIVPGHDPSGIRTSDPTMNSTPSTNRSNDTAAIDPEKSENSTFNQASKNLYESQSPSYESNGASGITIQRNTSNSSQLKQGLLYSDTETPSNPANSNAQQEASGSHYRFNKSPEFAGGSTVQNQQGQNVPKDEKNKRESRSFASAHGKQAKELIQESHSAPDSPAKRGFSGYLNSLKAIAANLGSQEFWGAIGGGEKSPQGKKQDLHKMNQAKKRLAQKLSKKSQSLQYDPNMLKSQYRGIASSPEYGGRGSFLYGTLCKAYQDYAKSNGISAPPKDCPDHL